AEGGGGGGAGTARGSLVAEHRKGRTADQPDGRQETDREGARRRQHDAQHERLGLERPGRLEDEAQDDPGQESRQGRTAEARGGAETRVFDRERARDGPARGPERLENDRLVEALIAG